MWIFCCGMMRSGSTLQFQITAQIVEEANLGKQIKWIEPQRFPELCDKYADYNGWKVFKTHICTKEMASEFERKNALGVYVFRDVRDVIASAILKSSRSFDQLWNEGFLDVCLRNFQKWTSLPGVLISKYEEMILDLPGEVERIATHLGIPLDRGACERIASAYSIDKQLERIEIFKHGLSPEQKQAQGPVFDPETLLHINHIHSGKSGQWKQVLTPSQVALIEDPARNWLVSNGYELAKTTSAFCYTYGGMSKKDYRYFSQNGEDFLLWNFFNYKESGFYVDVGAFDGVHLSNTYSFEQQGWTGICIEPHPDYFALCKQSRPRSVCLNVACVASDDIDSVEFHIDESGLYSGILDGREDDIRQRYQRGWGIELTGLKRITVPASTLNAILTEHLPSGAEIDFISIDVEGTEMDVLRGLDLSRFRPRVLIIETNSDEAREAITTYLAQFGYMEARQLSINTFYVRDLKDAEALQAIMVEYRSEKNLHPLGEEYTLRPFIEGEYRSERQQYIERLQRQDEQLQRQKERLQRQDERLQRQDERLQRQDERLQRQEERLQRQEEQLEHLTAENRNLNLQLSQLRNSWSWKITGPLRKAGEILRRLKK